jgi:hypothetical protein
MLQMRIKMAISKRSVERALSGVKRLLPIIEQQKTRDVSEADTVTLVKDIMAEVFGFDKYTEISSEHAIRGDGPRRVRWSNVSIKTTRFDNAVLSPPP